MIIYRHSEAGEAICWEFQKEGKPLEKDYLSIPGDRIPVDISKYHKPEYINLNNSENTAETV